MEMNQVNKLTSFLFAMAVIHNAIAFAAEPYPFGIYGTWSIKNDNKAFSIVSEKGFNLVEVPPDRNVLDLCNKYRIQAFVSFNLSKETATDKDLLNKFEENMINKVRELKDHPALFGWYIVDEPNLKKIAPDIVIKLYKSLKTVDDVNPVYTYLAYPDTWKNYLNTADIIGISGYLRKRENVDVIKKRIDIMKNDLRNKKLHKKIWLVLHGFDYKFKGKESPYKSITAKELKETWNIALDEGIDGIMVYTLGSLPRTTPIEPYNLPRDRPDLWEEIDNLKKVIDAHKTNATN